MTQPPAADMRLPGAVLLISCYELGHQPLGIALPLGFLERAECGVASGKWRRFLYRR